MEVKAEKIKQLFEGRVVSDKMDKTIVVEIEQTYIHPKFRKILRKVKSYKVHDEENQAKTGDIVKFYQCRPLAKTKYMYLAEVVTGNKS
ncbi:MAG TPA: 30S ribosomal protein S17 [Candidatus Babeliales bacterium]|nr:30S ribosomal protein S17 [Candidatus Babeliales bacterium]